MDGMQPATQADIHRLDRKIDGHIQRLDRKTDRMAVAMVGMQTEIREIKETMATKTDVERILGAIDAFARKSWSHGDQLQSHESRLLDHERRISDLESRRKQ